MLTVTGLDLTEVGSFKNASVDFPEGLLYIRGLNKDSDPSNPTSNGAGKTLLVSTFPNVVFGAHPMALRKRDRKDLLGKGSSITLPIVRPEASYEIEQTSSKYKIYKDGEDQKVRTVALAEQYIKDIFPICEDDYYSRIYITTQQPYALQYASDADRLQKFVNIFNLDQHEQVKLYFAAKLRTLKDCESRIKILGEQAERIKRKISEITTSVTKDQYLEAKESLEALTSKHDELREKRHDLLVQQTTLTKLLEVESELDKLRKKYKFKTAPAYAICELKTMRKAARAWSDFDSENKRVQKQIDKLTTKLSELTKPLDSLQNFEKALDSAKDALRTQKHLCVTLSSLRADYLTLTSKFDALRKQIPLDWKPLTKSQLSDYAAAQTTLKLKKLLHSDCSDGKCPTCLSDVDTANIKVLVRAAEKKIKKYEEHEEVGEKFEQARILGDKIASLGFMQEDLDKATERVKHYEREVSSLTKQVNNAEVYFSTKRMLTLAKKEVREEPEYDRPDLSEDEIEDGIELCSEILGKIEVKNSLMDGDDSIRTSAQVEKKLSSVSKSLKALDIEEKDLQKEIVSATDAITEYTTYVNHRKILRGELSATTTEIDTLKPQLKDRILVEALVKAYGSKGLRCIQADRICQLYEQRLNEYSTLTFAEPFIFKVTAYEGGISIMATGKDKEYDVRKLSGAESNSFRLASAAALETLTPNNRKCNLKIFDEPTEHMCPVSRALIRERFIPLIREITPTVIIITNNEEDVDPDSSQWTVIKENGLSEVVIDR